jgi:SSS family solute:Na+ symporter
MSNSVVALTVIFAIIICGSIIGFYAGVRHKMNLEQWTVGGRGFGLMLIWLLMAGEVYTTFSFLGASGWAYSRGGPTLYIIAYLTLGRAVYFHVQPYLWEVGRKFKMQTQPDFFERRYGSKYLAAFVAVVGFVFLIPYLQLQLTGLGIIVGMASFEGISRPVAMIIAFALVAGFVFSSGVRGVAWVSILKDALMLFVVFFIGFGLPYIYFHGIGPMFTEIIKAKPAHLVLPGATKNMGHAWYISTVFMASLGGLMWPNLFATSFAAKNGSTLRRSAVVMTTYNVILPLIFFIGFTALLAVPGLKDGDLALLALVRKTYPAWLLGVVGGTGALTAMVPAAYYILTAATLFAKNFYRPMFAPSMSDDQVAKLAKRMVLVVTGMALYLAIYSSTTLVYLLLIGFAGVSQFFPGVVLGLWWRRITMPGAFSGIVVGVATASFLMLTKRDPFMGINAGFFALCLNFLVTVGVSSVTRFQPSGFGESSEASTAG